MQATAERVMGGGFWRNSVSELKLKNRCTGSTWILDTFQMKQKQMYVCALKNLF